MNKVNYCVNCGSTDVKKYNSLLNRFVVDRMLGLEKTSIGPVSCESLHCNVCDFRSIGQRFTAEEERRYYKNYMKEEYINHRFLYDNRKDHLLVFSTDNYKKMRRTVLDEVLSDILPINTITSVLDFGGDTGELIPESLSSSKKYLLDIEDRDMPSDVISIKSAADVESIDLIICGHTLEHVSYPVEMIEHIKTFMNAETYLYIEVPNENNVGYFHEHINQFSLSSLRTLIEKNGMTTIELGEITYPEYIESALYITGKLQ